MAACATREPVIEGAARCRVVDVSDADAVDRFASEAAERLGPLSLWINNAGILGPLGPVRDTDAAEWRRCIDINLGGVVNGTRSFLAHRTRSAATLVNIASRVAVDPAPGLAAYSATKAAVVAFTRSVAEEEAGMGLRALAVLPPSVDTDMQDTLLAQDATVLPGIEHSRQRKREGGVLPADAAADAILEVVLRERPFDSSVVDLTTLRSTQ